MFTIPEFLAARKPGSLKLLRCPHCRSELGTVFQAVASRRCPKCRARGLADPEPAPVPSEG